MSRPYPPTLAGIGLALYLAMLPNLVLAQSSVAQQVAALPATQQAKLSSELRAFVVDRERAPDMGGSLGLDGMVHRSTGAEDAAYVMIRGNASDTELARLGVRVMTRTPVLSTVFVPLSSLPQLLTLSDVEAVDAPHAVDKHLDISAYSTGVSADNVWGTRSGATWSGLSGKNVIVGVIDTGLDLTHKDFQTTAGKTRLKFLWDQAGVGAPPPSGYNYGSEWSGTVLDLNLAVSTDTDGHGTHVTGIAAGNGQATGGTYSAYRYVGIAPQADLIIVNSILTDASILDGVKYIFAKATSLNEDAVILLASGNERGAHDGGADLDQSLSALTGPGHIIVGSVGNNGAGTGAIHAQLSLASGATGSFFPVIPTYSPSTGEYLDVQSWHLGSATFQVRVTSPTGIQSSWIQPGGTSGAVATADGAYTLTNDQTTNPKGRKEIDLYVWWQGGTTPKPKSGTWKIDLQRLSGSTTGQIDAWISGWRFGSGNVSPTLTGGDNNMTIASPSSADSIIAVTAYCTRSTWTDFLGQTSFYTDNPTIQDFYGPSSLGPRLDGVIRPDVAAPGEGVISALSTPVSGSAGNLKSDDGAHWILRGTSQAAAHIAGAAADLLQQYPHSSPSAIRKMLQSKVRSDSFTGSLPSAKWGYGKFDFRASAVVAVGDGPHGAFGLSSAWPNPARGTVNFEFVLSSNDIAKAGDQGVKLEIFDARGRLLSSIPGSPEPGQQRVSWSGLSEMGYPAPAGLYLARLQVGSRSAITKFVRIAP
jgi:subtilisin family serine protease